MIMEKYIDDFIKQMETRGLSIGNIQANRKALQEFCRELEKPSDIKEKEVIEYFNAVQRMKCASITKSKRLYSVKSFCLYLMDINKLILNKKCLYYKIKQTRGLPKNIWSESDFELILTKLTTEKLVRIRAVIELCYSCGLRANEVIQADLFDLNLEEKTLMIKKAKTGDRLIPVTDKAILAMQDYFKSRQKIKSKTTALFLNSKGKRITKYDLHHYLKSLTERFDLKKQITIHAIRNSIGTHLLRRGMDFVLISIFLGHSNLKTTTIYTRIVPIDLKEMIDDLHPRNSMAD